MARYRASSVSQTAQLSGVNATTTVNGYMGYLGASASWGFRLRKVTWALMTTTQTTIANQQVAIGVYRQTVAPAGTGLAAAVAGIQMETWTNATDPTTGLIMTTATTIGTTGPTIGASPVARIGLNSQNTFQEQMEGYEELVCNAGTANGVAFVILGLTLPAGAQIWLDVEYEV